MARAILWFIQVRKWVLLHTMSLHYIAPHALRKFLWKERFESYLPGNWRLWRGVRNHGSDCPYVTQPWWTLNKSTARDCRHDTSTWMKNSKQLTSAIRNHTYFLNFITINMWCSYYLHLFFPFQIGLFSTNLKTHSCVYHPCNLAVLGRSTGMNYSWLPKSIH